MLLNAPCCRGLSRCKLHELSPLQSVVLAPPGCNADSILFSLNAPPPPPAQILGSTSLTNLDLSWNLMSTRASVAFTALLQRNSRCAVCWECKFDVKIVPFCAALGLS